MSYDLSTIGEGQLRLTVESGGRLMSANNLRMTAACSEANVAGLLSQFGHYATWASVMSRSELAERVLREFRSVGVDMSHMVRVDEGRVALYFLEPGQYPLPGRVTYDRGHTPFRKARPADFDWDRLLDTRVLFLTGITAALTDRTAEVVRYAAEQATARGVDVVLDVNHRSMLWSGEKARKVLTPIAEAARVVLCARRDADIVFGLSGDGADVCRAMRDRFGCEAVVTTDHLEGVYLSSSTEGEHRFGVQRVPVVDRPGAGDAFVAGTIHGLLTGSVVDGVQLGQRTAAYAITHHGDLTHISPREMLTPVTSTDIMR